MKLSVITAVRNAVSTSGVEALEKCIASIAGLDIEHEHIIQDGCSTDGTTAALADLGKRYANVRVFTEKDTGIYNALNRGLEKAKGDWVYVLGADDYMACPERLMEALEKGERPKAVIVASPVGVSADLERRLPVSRTDVFSSMPYPHQGLLMRLDAIRRYNGFDEQYRVCADGDLVWRMLVAGEKVAFYDSPYAYYSLGGMSTGNDRLSTETQAIQQKLFGLSVDEADILCRKRVLPIRAALSAFTHKSPQIRRSARFFLLRSLANMCGLIGQDGGLKFK